MANTAFKQVKNHAQSTLASSITNSGTSISLPSGEGARFPQPGNGFYAWIWDQETYPDPYDDADREVVLVTARSTDTLTVTRAQKSTSGVAHNSGEAIRLMTDADLIDEIKAAINDLERPVDVVRWHDDFPVHGNSTTSLLTDVPWAVYGTSVAAIAANASNRMGIAGFYARFNASEYSGAHRGVSSIRLGDAAITIEAAVYIPTLATAGEDYTFRIGLGDGQTLAGRGGMAIADDPAAVLPLRGARTKALKALDEDDPFAGDLQTGCGRFGHGLTQIETGALARPGNQQGTRRSTAGRGWRDRGRSGSRRSPSSPSRRRRRIRPGRTSAVTGSGASGPRRWPRPAGSAPWPCR